MSATIQAAGRDVEISKPDKPLFPSGISKLDLARYNERVADAMLEHLAGRPLNLERFPDGIEGEGIVQQQAPVHFPGWIERAGVPKQCITLHTWPSRVDRTVRAFARDVADLVAGRDPRRLTTEQRKSSGADASSST